MRFFFVKIQLKEIAALASDLTTADPTDEPLRDVTKSERS